MKTINWHVQAWDDYIYWQSNDRRIVKCINALIKDHASSTG
ncbi:type II toxin-antitoxin system YoeB family toxin [Desulfamplus magnetovallimortis]|nr:type II toxin-antitoxin system YoeB family toxin [Desulfamplus magnetovallimortis]